MDNQHELLIAMKKEFLKREYNSQFFLIFESETINCLDFKPFNGVYSLRFQQLCLVVKDREYET